MLGLRYSLDLNKSLYVHINKCRFELEARHHLNTGVSLLGLFHPISEFSRDFFEKREPNGIGLENILNELGL